MTADAKNASRPAAWAWAAIDEILLALESGGRPRGGVKGIEEGIPSIGGEHILWSGDFDFTNIRYVPEEYYEGMNKGKIATNDVLVVKDGATTGKTGLVSASFPFSQAAVNEHVFVMRVFEPYLEPKYLFFWMQSPLGQESVKDNFKGTAQGGINTSFVRNAQLPIAPLREQQRIVAKIEELFTQLDAGVAALEKAKAQLRRYRQAVLKAAVDGDLTKEWRDAHKGEIEPASALLACILEERRTWWEAEQLGKMKAKGTAPKDDKWKERYKEPAGPDTNGLPQLPEVWVWTTAEQVSDETRAITYGVIKLGSHEEDGIPTLRSSNVRHLHLDLENVKCISREIAGNYTRTSLQGGEVLVTVRGTLGGVAVVPRECRDFNISREVAMIALVCPLIAPCVSYFIGSMPIQTWLLERTKGIAYIGINIETLKRTPIPLPALPEQRQIAQEIDQRLSLADQTEKAVEQSLERAGRLRQSILRMAFEGRLVPQDRTDEPASVLLERIEAEKNERETEKETRKSKPMKDAPQQLELI